MQLAGILETGMRDIVQKWLNGMFTHGPGPRHRSDKGARFTPSFYLLNFLETLGSPGLFSALPMF
jgi:hypothetical protein